jgi:hypothetical protein
VLQGGERQEELHLHPDPDEEEVTQVTAILILQERLKSGKWQVIL